MDGESQAGANAGRAHAQAAGRGEGTQPRRHKPGDRPRKLPAHGRPQTDRKQENRGAERRSQGARAARRRQTPARKNAHRQSDKKPMPPFSLSLFLSSLNSPQSFAAYMAESGRDMAERTEADPVAGGGAQKEHTTAAAKAQAEPLAAHTGGGGESVGGGWVAAGSMALHPHGRRGGGPVQTCAP